MVAEADGQIVAVGQVRQHPGCQELGSLVTLRAYRRQGIASRLMAALEARAGRPLYLFCPHYRASFYRQHGYVDVPYRLLPAFLKFKYLFALAGRLMGIRVHKMRKD